MRESALFSSVLSSTPDGVLNYVSKYATNDEAAERRGFCESVKKYMDLKQ